MGRQRYEKPKHELMRDFINDMNLRKDEAFTKKELIDDFKKKYDFEESGIKATIRGMTVNDNSRTYHNHEYDVLWKIDGQTLRLYDKEKDTAPLYSNTTNNVKKQTKDKQELKPIWLECLRELFEKAEKQGKEEIIISALDLQHHAQSKNIPNIILDNRIPSITNAMRSCDVMEDDDDEIEVTDSKNSSTYTIKYKLPRRKVIEEQNLMILKRIFNMPKKTKNKDNSISEYPHAPTSFTSKINSSSEPYEKTVREAKELIRLINQNCKNLGNKPIFKESELFELLIDIEKGCSSKEGFEVFSSSLYKLIVENPRDENPNFKKTGGHFYEYRYSKYSSEFWRDGTITKDFIDDVKTIRHEFAHTKLEKKTPVKTKAEVLQKYLGSSIEPRLPEKYQEFQLGVLKEFMCFLNKLLEMVENYKPSLTQKPLTSQNPSHYIN